MTKLRFLNSTALALACALSLAACGKQDATTTAVDEPLPLTNAPPTAIVEAPPPEALPPAPRPRIAARATPEDDDYSYVDRAYAMSDAIGDAPPDYGFDYQDSHPWVWRSTNRSTRMVEPVSGGYRDYYYQPGADRPYLVRDPQYAYGFSNGELVAVYDGNGRLLPYREWDRRDDDAGRILARAAALYGAARSSERRAVNAANWAAQQSALANKRAKWQAAQNQQDSWRTYHAAHAVQDQNDWRTERARREQSAQSFNDWRARGYSGPPPPVTAGNRADGQQQRDQARQAEDQARQQQDRARQEQDKAKQQQDQARQVEDKARQQRQADADKASARKDADKARQESPRGNRANAAPAPKQAAPVAVAAPAAAPAPVVAAPAAAPAPAPAAAPPAAAAAVAPVVAPPDRKAQQEARRLARKKLDDEARARDGKPPQP